MLRASGHEVAMLDRNDGKARSPASRSAPPAVLSRASGRVGLAQPCPLHQRQHVASKALEPLLPEREEEYAARVAGVGERSEALDAQKKLADDAVEAAETTLVRERLRANETVAKDKTLLAAVEAQRAAERAKIGEAALSTYDRIAKGKGTAVSEALNQKCTACQMMVRPQRWNELRDRSNDDQMMTCESCGRLLYYDPARDSPQRKTVPVESIAAQIVRSL